MRLYHTLSFVSLCSFISDSESFQRISVDGVNRSKPQHPQPQQQPSRTLLRAKGFGASSGRPHASKKPKRKDIEKTLKNRYGGTTPQAIAQGTQRSIENALQEQPEHIQRAAKLYQTLRKWDAYCNRLTILQQTSIDPEQLAQMEQARSEYARLCETNDQVSDRAMHDLFQTLTWDASADAKAARVMLGGTMSSEIKERIQTACRWAKESVGDSSICLDVGTGYGAIVPDLLEAGLRSDQIYGIDLSSEMIRNAKTMYGKSQFAVANFYEFRAVPNIAAVLFCSALHDMPDIPAAIQHAASILSSSSEGNTAAPPRVVLVHAQGAQHVVSQVEANPVLVPRPLPDEQELRELASANGMKLIVAPAAASTPRDVQEGYLAVLERCDNNKLDS